MKLKSLLKSFLLVGALLGGHSLIKSMNMPIRRTMQPEQQQYSTQFHAMVHSAQQKATKAANQAAVMPERAALRIRNTVEISRSEFEGRVARYAFDFAQTSDEDMQRIFMTANTLLPVIADLLAMNGEITPENVLRGFEHALPDAPLVSTVMREEYESWLEEHRSIYQRFSEGDHRNAEADQAEVPQPFLNRITLGHPSWGDQVVFFDFNLEETSLEKLRRLFLVIHVAFPFLMGQYQAVGTQATPEVILPVLLREIETMENSPIPERLLEPYVHFVREQYEVRNAHRILQEIKHGKNAAAPAA